MIAVNCCVCGNELDEPGAIAFSPPDVPFGMVDKFHICKACWFGKFRPALVGQKLVPTFFKAPFPQPEDYVPQTEEQIAESLRNIEKILGPKSEADVLAEVSENPYDVVMHDHGKRVRHIHAWGSEPHSHLLRAICRLRECEGFETHNIHSARDKKGFLDSAIDRVKITGDGVVHFGESE